jgi:hypothetical protein
MVLLIQLSSTLYALYGIIQISGCLVVLGFGLYAAESHLQDKPADREDAKLKVAEFYWLACNASVPADSTMVRKNSHQKFCCLTASRISMHSCAVEAGIGLEVLTHFIALTKIWFVCVMMLAVINLSAGYLC